MEKEKTYSSHHFIFTFRWDCLPPNKTIAKVSFDDRTCFKNLDKLLKNSKWVGNKELTHHDFNHYTYFYRFLRNSLYDINQENNIVRYYEYDISDIKEDKKKYIITYYEKIKRGATKNEKKKGEKELILDVKGITLFLFNTGVGTLSFDLENTLESQSKPDDILKINEYGRRIYPQFLNTQEDYYTFNAQRVFLSKSIQLFNWKEDFNFYNDTNFDYRNPTKLPKFISELFKNTNLVNDEKDNIKENRFRLKPITDDRMFFISWYGNDAFSSDIGNNYKNNNWWYAYIFGDKEAPSIANKDMKQEHIKNHTYERWSEYGTLFGMSRDSFVCLSASESYFEKEDLPNLKEHQNSIYYQIAILCLVQRASVLKFSAEVAKIADVAKENSDKLTDKIENIYANYIEFLNKIYFREVTSQIQGIEIYNKFQKVMNIHNDVKDLDSEIEELNRFANLLYQRKENKESKKHTLLASLFLPAMLISGILGMNTLPNIENLSDSLIYGEVFKPFKSSIVLILFATIYTWIVIKITETKNQKIKLLILIFWSILILSFLYKYFK